MTFFTELQAITGLQAVWVFLHIVGLAAAWMVQMLAHRRSEWLAQLTFLVCMPAIALATVVGQQLCLTTWPLSATTLAVMIVLATADFSPRSNAMSVID